MKSFSIKRILTLSFIAFLPYISSAQCAMCRAALQTGDQEATAEGINHGITYLMIFPYIIAGIMAYAIYRIYKKESQPAKSSI